MAPLPAALKAVLDGPNFAHLATVDDAGPHNTAMWVMRDGDHVIMNTLEGRVKWHNLRADPRVGISISPMDQPYRNYSMRGRVVEMRTSDGKEVIDRLAQKYLGEAEYPWLQPGDVRVTLVIEIDDVARNG